MAISTLSLPIDSSLGAADTTAGRIYFSTPSAQVRVPVGDLVSPPPLMLTLYYLREKLSGGEKIIRRPKNFAAAEWLSRAGAGGPKIRKKSENCRTVPKIPYSLS